MSHATEGELHAYLDGALSATDPGAAERLVAHLVGCVDCRARLEEERAIRERAGELLGVALPTIEAPPFETLARVAGVRRARGGMTTRRMAWAASVVLALGAGWMGNAMLRGTPGVAPSEPDEVVQMVVEDPEAAARRSDTGDPKERLRADLDAARMVEEPAPLARRAIGRASVADDEVTASALKYEARTEQVAQAPVALEDAVELDEVVDLEETLDWREASLDEAGRWMGTRVLWVSDLEIMTVEVAAAGGRRMIRIRQALPGGEALELIQEALPAAKSVPADALADRGFAELASPAAGETASQRVRIEGVWVTASAPLASDSLRALVSKIR